MALHRRAHTDPSPADGAGKPPRGHAERLAGMSLPKQVAVLAVWPFLELLLNALVGLVDTRIAGHLTVTALDAIGVATYVGWLISMLHNAVGIGAGALIARAVGARRTSAANAALGQALIIGVVWGVITAVAMAVAAPWIAAIFRMPPATADLVVTYLRILSVGVGFGAVMTVGNAALRSAGDTRTPFFTMVFVNVANTLLSVLFTFGPQPFGGHGVAGIAAGTAVAWMLGALLVLGVLWRGRSPLRLRSRRLRPRRMLAGRIIKVGVPSLVENSGMWLGNAAIGGIVGTLMARNGVDGIMGAHVVAIRLEMLSFLPGVAVGIAAATLAGQHLGRGDVAGAERAVRMCWWLAGTVMGLSGVVLFFAPHFLAGLLAAGPEMAEVRARAVPLLMICGPIQIFFATYLVLSQALRGAGDTRGPMAITYAGTFLIRLPGAWLLAVTFDLGLNGVWFALCGELVVRGLLYAWRFRGGVWKTLRV